MRKNYIQPVMAMHVTHIDTAMMAGSPFGIGVEGDKDGSWDAEVKEEDFFGDGFFGEYTFD